MKKISVYLFIVVLLFAGFLTSCKKNDPSLLGFKMKAVDTGVNNLKDSEGSATGLAVLPLAWDTAWIYVSKVGFEAEFDEHSDSLGGNDSFEVKFEWKGHQLINLLGEPQVFATIDLPDGLYDEIELKIKSEKQEITGNPNFYLSGLYGSVAGDLRVVLLVSEDFEIGNEFEDWVINTENVSFYDGLLEISLQQLFNGISSSSMAGFLSQKRQIGRYMKKFLKISSPTWTVITMAIMAMTMVIMNLVKQLIYCQSSLCSFFIDRGQIMACLLHYPDYLIEGNEMVPIGHPGVYGCVKGA
jgi:hypothetical protein